MSCQEAGIPLVLHGPIGVFTVTPEDAVLWPPVPEELVPEPVPDAVPLDGAELLPDEGEEAPEEEVLAAACLFAAAMIPFAWVRAFAVLLLMIVLPAD